MAFYFENTENTPFLTKKIQKNKFCASFPLYFLHVFLVSVHLDSEYEQSLISSHIGASTLVKLFKSPTPQRQKEQMVTAPTTNSKDSYEILHKLYYWFMLQHNIDNCSHNNLATKQRLGCQSMRYLQKLHVLKGSVR
jgi:hypothetical protein